MPYRHISSAAAGLLCRHYGLARLPLARLSLGEVLSLQDVVGERVPEHDGANLVDAAHTQLPEVPIAPAGMDAFAEGEEPGLCLGRLPGHACAPGQRRGAVARPRQEGIDTAPGFGRWTKDLDALVMSPLDLLGAAEPAIDEMAAGKTLQRGARAFQHRPHQAAV